MNHKKTFMLAAVLLALLLTVAVSGTLAYLTDISGPLQNVFSPTEVKVTIDEKFENNIKQNVVIKNPEDPNSNKAPVYVRAAIVVTWQNGSGEVYGKAPVPGTDYSMEIGSGWTLNNGFYYYGSVVPVGGETAPLIVKCTQDRACEDPDYTLSVEIVVQAIQAEGMGASGAIDAFSKAEAVN